MMGMAKPTSSEVLERGTSIFFTHTLSQEDLEDWVETLCRVSHQPFAVSQGIHRSQGEPGAYLFVLGDLTTAVHWMLQCRAQHDEAFRKALPAHRQGSITWQLDGLWAPVELMRDAFQALIALPSVKAPSPAVDRAPLGALRIMPVLSGPGSQGSTSLVVDLNSDDNDDD